MKLSRKTLTMTATLVALLASVAASAGDAPGSLEFKAQNEMYKAHGKFQKWHFTDISIPDGDLTQGSVTFEIDLASVWENSDKLADHLRQPDFFNVVKMPTATVKIDRAKKVGDNSYEATAAVSFMGVTREVPVKFDVVGTAPLAIEGSAVMDRTAFSLGGPPHDASKKRSIANEVEIMIAATVE